MHYRTILCPYCGLELQVPEDAAQTTCSYCAKRIDLQTLLTPTREEPDGGARLQQAMSLLDPSLLRFQEEEKAFNAKAYPARFQLYAQRLAPVLDALHGAQKAECQSFAETLADNLMEDLRFRGIQNTRSNSFFTRRLMIASYLIPALHDVGTPEALAVLDAFLHSWNQLYPQAVLSPASYADINSGFHRKGCYISSAVCAALHKPDDCAELNLLRRFRDDWLQKLAHGGLLVREYYIFAPRILAAMRRRPDCAAVFARLWQQYLAPCVADAANGRNEACFARYLRMMLVLERRYLH